MLASGLLLPHAIVAEKRPTGCRGNVVFPNEGHVLTASDREQQAKTEARIRRAGILQNTGRDGTPITKVSPVNHPWQLHRAMGPVELGSKPLRDPTTIQRHHAGVTLDDNAYRSRGQANDDVMELVP